MSRENCYNCYRPKDQCYCSHIKAVDTAVKFVFLMHPWEAYKQRTGTGRLTALSLVDSEIIIGKSFDENSRYRELLEDKGYYPVVLYPGESAMTAGQFCADPVSRAGRRDRKLLVFLVDATWVMARKMVHHTPSLQTLPRLSFSASYRSQFHIKKQPASFCLSTIESTYYLIREMQDAGLCSRDVSVDHLMEVFERLNRFQMESERLGRAASGGRD